MHDLKEDVYPSRTGGPVTVLARRDPVVYGTADPGPLSKDELAQYERDGFLQRTGLFDGAEIARLWAAVDGLRHDEAIKARPETIREPNDDTVRSVFRPEAFSEAISDLVHDPRLVHTAEQILGGPVYLHQTRVNFKPAFTGKEFYWHSDFETWHVEDGLPRMRTLSISVNLTENNEFNGPLMVIPGSHRHYLVCGGKTPENHFKESLRSQRYGTPDPEALTKLAHEYGIQAPKGPAGSMLIFDSNMMHGSGANISPLPRCNIFAVYNSVDNPPQAPFSGLKRRPDYISNPHVQRVCARKS